jgi:Zn-dependent metalloprotease
MPEDAGAHYGERGTPAYIKGDNLSSHLDADPAFTALKSKGLYVEIAYEFLRSRSDLIKIENPRLEFRKEGVSVDELDLKHVRFQQVANEMPIWGRQLSVHLNRDNQVYLVQGRYEPTLKDVAVSEGISAEAAAERAVEEASREGNGWRAIGSEKYIFMAAPDTPRLAYLVTVVRGIAGRDYYFVDALSGKVLHVMPGTYDAK